MEVALVTGGSGGIGSAICRELAKNGVTVAVGYHSQEETAKKLAGELGGMAVYCDVADPSSVQKAVDNVLEKFCQLDILVCAAGVSWTGLFQDMTEEDYRRVMGANLDGAVYCCQTVLPPMIRAKRGKILLISSIWGRTGGACEVAYSAAKAGLHGLTKALAAEVGPSGIRVNCLAPGVIDTKMNAHLGPQDFAALCEETPLGRTGEPEEVAKAAWFLVSEASSFITGQVIGVDGGFVR